MLDQWIPTNRSHADVSKNHGKPPTKTSPCEPGISGNLVIVSPLSTMIAPFCTDTVCAEVSQLSFTLRHLTILWLPLWFWNRRVSQVGLPSDFVITDIGPDRLNTYWNILSVSGSAVTLVSADSNVLSLRHRATAHLNRLKPTVLARNTTIREIALRLRRDWDRRRLRDRRGRCGS